jgi:uncharacterized protein with PIN domain
MKSVMVQNEKLLKELIKAKHFKFIVDGMLKKLAYNLRNIGLDAVFAEEGTTGKDLLAIAHLEERIILTRDSKLINMKKEAPLIKIMSNDPYQQLITLMHMLQIKVKKEDLLSRCVKCNSPHIDVISVEEALKSLNWENQESNKVTEFWRCRDCSQIYWEGGTFDRAKKMFEKLIEESNLAVPSAENSDGSDTSFDERLEEGERERDPVEELVHPPPKEIPEVLAELEELKKVEEARPAEASEEKEE